MAESAESNQPRKREKRKKHPVLSEVLEEAKELIASCSTAQQSASHSRSPASSSRVAVRKRRAPATYHFRKDSVTGQRLTHCQYRPRRSKTAEKSLDVHIDDVAAVSDDDDYTSIGVDEPATSAETTDLACVLQAANKMLQEWRATKAPKQNWGQRTTILNESWAGLREGLLNTLVSGHAVDKTSCMKCSENTAVVHCYNCHIHTRLCWHCDQLVHKMHPFHDRDALMRGCLKPIPSSVSMDCDGQWVSVDHLLPSSQACLVCPKCNSCDIQTVGKQNRCIVVNLKGRFDMHHVLFRCQQCHKDLPTSNPLVVTQFGFWPGSVSNMTYVFDQELFLHWDLFQKESPGSSERSFVKSLEQFSLRKGRVGTINSKAFSNAFKEWKFCQYELDLLRHMDWMKCPACEKHQHSVHVDGNMKLYRFKSAGIRQRECYYGDAFIASNKEVDKHIQKVYQGSKHSAGKEFDQNMCGDTSWRAAGNTLRKKKNLCETGLEIAGCRHSVAQKAVNMMYGEIYGYAHYLQTAYFIPRKVEFFWYDVVCKFWPWLKKHDSESEKKMKPALSVMHAKAHSWSCQVVWGGRWQNGASATTGEEVEQINSHFSRLGTTTKHMLPEGREELLTEHALQWNRKKVEKLPRTLADRYSKTKLQLSNAKKDLLEQLKQLNHSVDVLTAWKEELYHAALEKEKQNSQPKNKAVISQKETEFLLKALKNGDVPEKHKALCETAKQIYGQQYDQIVARSAGMQVNSDTDVGDDGEKVLREKAIAHCKKKMESYHYSISQMVYNMAKLGDSSRQRQKLRTKVSRDKDSLKKVVSNYNDLVGENDKVVAESIEKGDFPWQLTDCSSNNSGNIPIGTKRSVVDKQMEVERFKEELILLKKEMSGFMSFYKDDILPTIQRQKDDMRASLIDTGSQTVDLENCTNESENVPVEKVIKGKISLLEQGKEYALKQIEAGLIAFASVLSDELHSFRDLARDADADNEEQEEDDTDESAAEEDDEEDDDEERTQQVEEAIDTVPDDSGVTEFDKIVDELHTLPPLHAELVSDEICVWTFPQRISQSTFNGRNGSNACSMISILLAYFFVRKGIEIPDRGILPAEFVKTFCGSIELGNRMYDLCRHSLPNRYLSIEEAVALLSFTDISTPEPLSVRLEDDHELSTICCQLGTLIENRTYFATIIINERTSLFMLTPPYVLYIDTHLHGIHGAVVVRGTYSHLGYFCKFVWELESHEKNTYGNLNILALS